MQGGAQIVQLCRVGDDFAVGVGEVEDVFDPFAQGGDFGVIDVQVVGEEDAADGGEQAVSVLAGEFKDAALLSRVVFQFDAGGDGEVAQSGGGQAFF